MSPHQEDSAILCVLAKWHLLLVEIITALCCMHLSRPDSKHIPQGEVIVMGQPRRGLLSDTQEEKQPLKIGMVFQSAALFDSLTVSCLASAITLLNETLRLIVCT